MASDSGAVIYYTTDWSEPTTTSPRYVPGRGIKVSETTTIKARAVWVKLFTEQWSPVTGGSYIFKELSRL
jgi:hypothetical protein